MILNFKDVFWRFIFNMLRRIRLSKILRKNKYSNFKGKWLSFSVYYAGAQLGRDEYTLYIRKNKLIKKGFNKQGDATRNFLLPNINLIK